jgi:hypothetical protein
MIRRRVGKAAQDAHGQQAMTVTKRRVPTPS